MNQNGDEDDNDEDYDFKEFEDADVEEAEDRIYTEYKRRVADGTIGAMDDQVLNELAGSVPLDDMETSVIMSARNGAFSASRNISKNHKREKSQQLDLSSMLASAARGPSGKMEMMFAQTAATQNNKRPGANRQQKVIEEEKMRS